LKIACFERVYPQTGFWGLLRKTEVFQQSNPLKQLLILVKGLTDNTLAKTYIKAGILPVPYKRV